MSQQTDRRFVEVSAVSAGVKEVRAAIDAARAELVAAAAARPCSSSTRCTASARPSRTRCCPGVENRWVTLVAATTENPFFSVISPLLSRSLLLRLESLTDDDVRGGARPGARATSAAWAATLGVDEDALDHLVRLAGGDARRSLTYLEAAAGAAASRGLDVVDLATAETAVDQAAVRYDRQGDQHYDVTSAFIKSVRGSDADAALHYLARMMEAGEDPRFIARRLVILASEDIGLADPTALTTAVAAAQAVQLIGMPEARLNLAQATIALAVAPKSNAVTTAIGAAIADVRAGKIGPVPAHLRDAHYSGAKRLGHGATYQYSHDAPYGIAEQQYAPDVVAGRRVLPAHRARRRGRDQGALGAGPPPDPRRRADGQRPPGQGIGSGTMQEWIVPAAARRADPGLARGRRRAARARAPRPRASCRSAHAEVASLRARVEDIERRLAPTGRPAASAAATPSSSSPTSATTEPEPSTASTDGARADRLRAVRRPRAARDRGQGRVARPRRCAARWPPRPATGSASRCAARSSGPASSGAPT